MSSDKNDVRDKIYYEGRYISFETFYELMREKKKREDEENSGFYTLMTYLGVASALYVIGLIYQNFI